MTSLTPRSSRLLRIGLALSILAGAALAYQLWLTPVKRGRGLNRSAWEASYLERGLPVPSTGPREGYWGSRLGEKVPDARFGWREREVHVAGLLDLDLLGQQRFSPRSRPARRILVLGGSVAFGAYASSISRVYFHVLGTRLEDRGVPTRVSVIAGGAWKSSQELAALEAFGEQIRPDLVIFLNGLNDVTVGARFDTLYGESVETADDTPWSVAYHAHDYGRRVAAYLAHMERAARWTSDYGASLLVALQPALSERGRSTRLEEKLLRQTLPTLGSRDALLESYQDLREGLAALARQDHVTFLDLSRRFDAERETTFADLWHFSDPGHALVGEALADSALSILPPGGAAARN